MKTCCQDCFADQKVKTHIEQKGAPGTCDYCGSESAKTIRPFELNALFNPWLVHYEDKSFPEQEGHGITLVERIKAEGWKVFSNYLSDEDMASLLDAIQYEDINDVTCPAGSGNWISFGKELTDWSAYEKWRVFSYHIQHKRRFRQEADGYEFLSKPEEWLPPLLESKTTLRELEPCEKFFRARTDGEKNMEGEIVAPRSKKEMEAPPNEKATRGRANPAGIPYLYAADTPETAVAEVRPYVGQFVSIREVTPKSILRLADLSKLRELESPFQQEDLFKTMERMALLNRLKEELAKPIDPTSSEVDYVPTQYLAELIFNAGFDGIIYQSAVHLGGVNVVFFQPEKLQVSENVRFVKVESMTVKFKDCFWDSSSAQLRK